MSSDKEILSLRKTIQHHNNLYYKHAAPEISDADYDRLKRKLEELEVLHPVASEPNSPTQDIGDDRH